MNYLNDERISDDLWIYSYDIKSELVGLRIENVNLKAEVDRLDSVIVVKDAQIAKLTADLAECEGSTEPPPTPETYFNKDFTGVTLSPKSNNTGMNFNNWGLNELDECSASLNFIAGNVNSSILASIVKDNGRDVLQGTVLDDDPNWSGTSRFQMDVSLSEAIRQQGLIHMSHRMYLHPDMAHMVNIPNFNSTWFTLLEYWFEGGGDSNPAGNGRITVYVKEPVAGKLVLRAEMQRTPSGVQQLLWREDNMTFDIPFGKWATWDYLYKRGEGANGQFKLVVTVDGESPVTVFDIQKTTLLTDALDKRVGYIAPFKLYGGDGPLYDTMRAAGKKIQALYNDFKWYKA
jgi:hypothetical protein